MLALIPLLPFLGFLVNASVGRRLSKTVSGGLASAVMLASFAIAALQVMTLADLPEASREIEQTVFTWIRSGDFSLDLTFRLDPLSAVMILVITGIGSLIHIYSTAYMHEETDADFARFFSYLNLFVFFMLVLVLGSNFLVMFVGWEGVGLCSYLLIGFYYVKKSAGDASKKAFIVNRVGDYAFVLGALLAFVTFGSLDFQIIAAKATPMAPEAAFGVLSLMTLLMFIGATGKSAQIPLYTWLPDAMEGPTPVSALIHAATMVTAGVYMIGRNAVLFEHAPITLSVVAVVGVTTALFAGTIGLVQNDIKRVLAYSTVSQLGYMFLAMGVGAFGAGIFHLYTHAFFKACLFLGSGAVIHALHGEQDIRHMGGLKKHLPVTFWTFFIASIAIAGIPGLAGFFSKDEILFETFDHGHQLLWAMGVVTSLLTATYMFRLVFLTFYGERRHGHDGGHDAHGHGGGHPPSPHGFGGQAAHQHLHDAPPAMAVALIVLALGSIGAGWIGWPHALGGHNSLAEWLRPSFAATAKALAECNVPVALPGAPAGMTLAECKPGDAVPAMASSAQTSAETAVAAAGQPTGGRPGGFEASIENEVEEAHAMRSEAEKIRLERILMAVSSLIAVIGIGLAAFLWRKNPSIPASLAAQFPGLHRLLLNKYYVDELYDAAIVHPIQSASTQGLWKIGDAKIIDGAVNLAGYLVAGVSAVLRLFQTGSVRSYAASTFVGVVLILGYYLWR